ncbi:hypothetical protein [Curvivirga sp.]|uniref:hypothetical protein n=1 Tax=Curvivirga sp. TaxID=2856848 RepID=UPI003B5B9628
MLFRWFGKLCILSALILLGIGLYIWLSGEDINKAAGQIWYQMHQPSLQYAQVIVERYLHASWFWTFFQNSILTLPAWDAIIRVFIALFLIGGIMIGLFKKPRSLHHRNKNKGIH